MANHVLLNNIEHQSLKINPAHSEQLGDNLWFSPTFPAEFRSVQAHYPIFFHKDSQTGQFCSVALFGFKQQENLFLVDNRWDAHYIPMSVQRMPFYIGQQEVNNQGVKEVQRVLTVDLDSPKVSFDQGVDVFLPYGGNSDYLENIAGILESLHHGILDDGAFIETLVAFDLIESVTLDIELKDKSKHQLLGFYTINEPQLEQLSEQQIVQLHKAGYLRAIDMVLASQSCVHALIARKNNQMFEQA
ncbi:SapC family protein [Thalassotalea sp. PLHSN55]|uniref:SapC family protein n=1 Tax=Thalassotalea sp. PLHSN55 TaxID=3435888 RepID=UPI003F85B64B